MVLMLLLVFNVITYMCVDYVDVFGVFVVVHTCDCVCVDVGCSVMWVWWCC